MTEITKSVIAKAKQMRANKCSWPSIAHALGVSKRGIRCHLDPDFKKREFARRKRDRKQIHGVRQFGMFPFRDKIERNPAYDPKRDGELSWESDSAFILGDPPLGRRAIDMRNAA